MSVLSKEKIKDFIRDLVRCSYRAEFGDIYVNNTSVIRKGELTKKLFLCAYAEYNQRVIDAARINKQQLYACLFCAGFPLGFIAKALLNANLGPIRNAVIRYAGPVRNFIDRSTMNVIPFMQQFINNNSAGAMLVESFANSLIQLAHYWGGMNLAKKLVYAQDQENFLLTYVPNATATAGYSEDAMHLFNSDMTLRMAMIRELTYFESVVPTRRGLVRRTGLTTSRNATTPADTVQLVRGSTPTQPVTVSTNSLSTPTEDAAAGAATRQSRQLVRDVNIDTTTFGIEIEGSFITDGLDSIKKPSNMNYVKYMKKIVDEMQLPAKEYKKDMTLKREGTLSMREEYEQSPTGTVCWFYKSDMSVYGGNETREIVSPILKGKNGIEQVRAICSAMRQSGFYANATAGVHVHLGAQGLSLETFKNICYNYTMFEPLVDMMFPSDRRWSNAYYAESFSQHRNWLRDLDAANSFDDLVRNLMNDRYYKVNLKAYYSLSTIEFRQCIGTNDDRLIIWFLHYCFYLMEVSKRKRLTNFDLKNLQDILPTWAFTYFVDRVRAVSGYDIKYGYDVGKGGDSYSQHNTNTRGGDPLSTPLATSRGAAKRRGSTNDKFI
jgi:Putative amidoligase enzyme